MNDFDELVSKIETIKKEIRDNQNKKEESVQNYTVADYFEKIISEKYEQDFEFNIEKIITYLKKNKDNIVIKQKSFSFKDKRDLVFNQDMQNGLEGIEVTDCIETLKCDDKFISLLNQYISRDASRLTLPLDVVRNMDFSLFTNLKELEIQGYGLNITKEFLEKIPNVKRIIGNFSVDENILKDSVATKNFSPCFCYNDQIFENKSSFFYGMVEMYSKNPHQEIDKILDFLENLGSVDLEKLDVTNSLDNGYVDAEKKHISYQKHVKDSYDLTKKKMCEDDCYALTINQIETIQDVLKVVHVFEAKGKQIDRVVLNLENKTYNDIYLLKELNKYDFMIKYEGESRAVSLSDFMAMRDTLDYYKELINQSNLSEFEKLIFAYDIIKSFEYKEVDEGQDLLDSRSISSIVRDGKIVCVGYSAFLGQLLKEVGIESYSFGTSVPIDGEVFGHQRNLVKVDDDKYNIHGVYALDSTWDDAKNLIECIDRDGNRVYRQGQENLSVDDTVVKYHDNLSSYRYFMIPGNKYEQVFEGESLPNLGTSIKYEETVTQRVSDKIMDSVETDKHEFMKSRNINPEKFLEAVKNVRFCEGYTIDNIDESLASVVTVNRMDEASMESLSIKR